MLLYSYFGQTKFLKSALHMHSPILSNFINSINFGILSILRTNKWKFFIKYIHQGSYFDKQCKSFT